MELIIKIMLIVFSILILSVYTVFLPVIEKKKIKKVIVTKITKAGKWFIFLVIVLIGLNIWALIYSQSKENETSQQLKDIKEALKNNGQTFDSDSKKIIGNNYTDNSFGDKIGFHGNNISDVRISNTHDLGVSSADAPYKERGRLLQTVRLFQKLRGIKSKEILLYYTTGTKGFDAVGSVEKILTDSGFMVYPAQPFNSNAPRFQKGLSIDTVNNKTSLIVGDLTN